MDTGTRAAWVKGVDLEHSSFFPSPGPGRDGYLFNMGLG